MVVSKLKVVFIHLKVFNNVPRMIKANYVLYAYDGKAWHLIHSKSGNNCKVLVQ